MEKLTDLKAILHSKRANIYLLEKCRVLQKDGRVLYLTESRGECSYWNIPIANTTCLLLGTGTSITQAAMRMLASAGVLVGFCGGGGTPLLIGTEIEWMTPQGEYRPTEYLQGWMSFWFNSEERLKAAKNFQESRRNYMLGVWSKDKELRERGFDSSDANIINACDVYRQRCEESKSVSDVLMHEALYVKQLYRYGAKAINASGFVRNKEAEDSINIFLTHGNYLAYGLAATALWVLGIPHGFAVMHGKTRRGALVFDVADLIKDGLVLPWAFICASEKMSGQEFRKQLMQKFTEHQSLDFIFNKIKDVALSRGGEL
jgi:CRISP-associated protein Cas1